MSFVQRYLSCLSLHWFSLGSYIALMTAMSLKEKHKMEPLNFFVSSAYAPHKLVQAQHFGGLLMLKFLQHFRLPP
ncbi:hypothetical protein LEMLEM_LOCUS7996 [Lemmus lemmus]